MAKTRTTKISQCCKKKDLSRAAVGKRGVLECELTKSECNNSLLSLSHLIYDKENRRTAKGQKDPEGCLFQTGITVNAKELVEKK